MSLTESKVRQAKVLEKTYFLADEDGLSLKVETNGKKTWCFRYTDPISKKRRRISLGAYPDFALKQARQLRDDYRSNGFFFESKLLVKKFFDVAEEWLQFKIKNSLNDTPRAGVVQLARACLQKDIYPLLKDKKIQDIQRFDLVCVIKQIEQREVKEPVKKACSYLNQIYDYAVAMGYCDFNLAHGLNKIAVQTKIKKNYPYLKSDQLQDFFKRLHRLETDPLIKKALLIKLYTGVRGIELLKAEPHHIDLKNKIWNIPALHIKQFRRKVILGHDIPDFTVPLSDQALTLFKEALQWSYGEKYIFASPRKINQPIHFNTLNLCIRKMGYTNDELTVHGLRSTFSTILNESGLFQDHWIEAQLSHIDKNRTRASYNHAQYLEQRKIMMQWWGDFIDQKGTPLTT